MSELFGKRLVAARKMASISLQELADKLNVGLNKQALSRMEQGTQLPDSTQLIDFANALNVTPDFFYTQNANEVILKEVDYRKYVSKLNKTEESAVLQKVKETLENYLEVAAILNMTIEVESFEYKKHVKSYSDVEDAATALRSQWNLGYGAVYSVVGMLEDKGYIVIDVEGPDAFDGLKAIFEHYRIIALNKRKKNVRKRLTALHEVAHHNLIFDEALEEKDIEKLCHAFAAAVLYPKERFFQDIRKEGNFYINELIRLKAQWGISISAIFARAFNLEIINQNRYTFLNMNYRKRGYHLDEPGDYPVKENTTRLEQMIQTALKLDLISINDAAHFTGTTVSEFRDTLKQFA